jgi:hypothetical protein
VHILSYVDIIKARRKIDYLVYFVEASSARVVAHSLDVNIEVGGRIRI